MILWFLLSSSKYFAFYLKSRFWGSRDGSVIKSTSLLPDGDLSSVPSMCSCQPQDMDAGNWNLSSTTSNILPLWSMCHTETLLASFLDCCSCSKAKPCHRPLPFLSLLPVSHDMNFFARPYSCHHIVPHSKPKVKGWKDPGWQFSCPHPHSTASYARYQESIIRVHA